MNYERLKIVGTALSPEFIYTPGPGMILIALCSSEGNFHDGSSSSGAGVFFTMTHLGTPPLVSLTILTLSIINSLS